MPTAVSHGIAALAIAEASGGRRARTRFRAAAVVSAALPDIDGLGLHLGVGYGSFFGHRGFFHSPFFALLLGLLVGTVFFREAKVFTKQWWSLVACLVLVTASHGILDAFTDGGLGVAFLSPFSNARYFFPWRPIAVSPVGLTRLLGPAGLRAVGSEMAWVWFPSAALFLGAVAVRRLRAGEAGRASGDASF